MRTLRSLLRGPLTTARGISYGLFFGILITVYILLIAINNSFLVTVPARGGSVHEGIIGAPKTINPVLATTDTDRALTSLVYAGLMKMMPDGSVVPEIAKEYSVSPDGRTYTFTLLPTKFHNGKALTSSDVAFTVSKLQNILLNQNQASYWQNISVETPNEHTVVFILPQSQSNFLERATFGILPEQVWKNIPDETFTTAKQNIKAVGAGAFRVESSRKNSTGVRKVTFTRNNTYVLGAPLLKKITVSVFDNQSQLARALQDGSITQTYALLPGTLATMSLASTATITSAATTTKAVLYHARGEGGALSNTSLTAALSQFIDKEKIIAIVENGYGTALDTSTTPLSTIEEAQQKLATLGYRVQGDTLYKGTTPVGISIATTNDPTMVTLATTLATELRSLGITVSVRNFDQGFFQTELDRNTFNAVLIKGIEPPRSYEAVLPLYTTTTPFVATTTTYDIVPSTLISPVLRYANVHKWYVKTEKLYPWVIKTKNTISN